MKPRIRFNRGVWYCGELMGPFSLILWPPYGHGSTPAEAYEDWRAQCRKP